MTSGATLEHLHGSIWNLTEMTQVAVAAAVARE
jgi:galactose-1-phosphate uridylyltransferase